MTKSIVKKDGLPHITSVGVNYNATKKMAVSQFRFVTVNDDGITFGEQIDYNSSGSITLPELK